MTSEPTLRVVSLESRNAVEMSRLLTRHGCEVISAPSMREIPLDDQHEAFEFGKQLLGPGCDVLILLTGVGTRLLIDALSTRHPREDVIAAFGRSTIVCRGPKPVAALKAMGLRAKLVAPEPNTWEDLLRILDEQLPVSGRELFVQEYGRSNTALLDALRARGAQVHTVPVYGWAMPLDTAPLAAAIDTLCAGEAEVITFTSAQQLEHLFQLAAERGQDTQLLAALQKRIVCASIGPVTSEAIKARNIPIDLEPEHPKMGHLATAVAARGRQLLQAKRAP